MRQRDSGLAPHFHRTARVGIGRDLECGVDTRRCDPKRARSVIAPHPAHRPHGRRENRESSFRKTQPGKRAPVRHPQCFEGVIGTSPRRHKGAAARSDSAAGQKRKSSVRRAASVQRLARLRSARRRESNRLEPCRTCRLRPRSAVPHPGGTLHPGHGQAPAFAGEAVGPFSSSL